MYIRYHIGCMYGLIHIYSLICICYHSCLIYVVSHKLTILKHTDDLMVFLYSDLLYDVSPYVSNAVYISLYGIGYVWGYVIQKIGI